MKTKFFSLFFAALCCTMLLFVPKKAQAVCYNGVYYVADGKTGYVTYDIPYNYPTGSFNYSSLSGDVYIESKVPELAETTKIMEYAFAYKQNGGMINIILPSTIKTIERGAFLNATKLYSIQLNEGLTSIGNYAFSDCSMLSSVYFPSTLKEIPKQAFENCTSLPAVALSSGIEFIGEGAFKGCTKLQSVKGRDGMNMVKTIGKEAFKGCTSLSEVRFSNGLTSIWEYAFYNCTKLENVSLTGKITTIGEFAFAKTGLKTLTVSWTTPLAIQANVFSDVNLSQCTLYVPKGCKAAYKNADVWKKFGKILEEGEIPITTGTQKIGDLYYYLREDLTASVVFNAEYLDLSGALTIPATVIFDKYSYTVTDMQKTVFMSCKKLTEVTLPNTITEIPESVFFGCTALTKVTLPTNLTKIEENAFYQCEVLKAIDFPLSLTEIGPAAFQRCNALTAVSIPANVTSLPDNCFAGCTSLASVTLNEGLQSIGHHCFNKTALKTIVLPSSLTSLAKSVFYNCNKLESIHVLRETPPTADENTFDSSPVTTCILFVPAGTHDAYAKATGWKNFTKIREKGVNERIKYGDFYYQLNEDLTAYLTYETDGVNNYKDLSGEITIDKFLWYQGSEYKVVAIEPNALQNCTGITKVNLPTTIDIIYGGAFKNCTNLEEINIPTALTHLDHYAFNGTKLFEDNKDEDGAVYYDGCLIYYPLNSKDGVTYEVKPGTRLLASYVFSGDIKLTGLILPEGLKCICDWALDYMQRLETLSLPSSLYYIEKGFCNNFKAIKSLYNYNPKPLNLSKVEKHFDGLNKSLCTLYVPKGSKAAYSAAEEWKDFPIVEMKGVYTVTFEDYNGTKLKTESVTEGNDATAPEDPVREGYDFIGWDKSYTNIQSDLTVTALYERKTYQVQFIDGLTSDVINTQDVQYGFSAIEPKVPSHEGYTFDGWDKEFDIIMDNTTVTAQYVEGQGVENVQRDDVHGKKVIINGILYFIHQGSIYDAQGKRLQ